MPYHDSNANKEATGINSTDHHMTETSCAARYKDVLERVGGGYPVAFVHIQQSRDQKREPKLPFYTALIKATIQLYD